jgi:hypothetical protein
MTNVKFVSILNPVTGKNVTVALKEGTNIWNPHRVDGPAHSSFWSLTQGALITDGSSEFHVDTNDPDGVLGIFQNQLKETLNIREICYLI